MNIKVYTDGSCNTKIKIGAWAALILADDRTTILKGIEKATTHNRMELTAVIKSIEFINKNYSCRQFKIFTDSQYVAGIAQRKERLKSNNYITSKGTPIQNVDLVKVLVFQIENCLLEFVKVKAHLKQEKQNNEINYNIKVDKLARKMLRQAIGDQDSITNNLSELND